MVAAAGVRAEAEPTKFCSSDAIRTLVAAEAEVEAEVAAEARELAAMVAVARSESCW